MPTLQRRTEALSAPEFRQLAEIPAEVEWFANLRNPNTRKGYQTDIRDFSTSVGIHAPDDFRRITRAHVIAWRDHLTAREFGPATIRRKLAALSSLYAYLSDRNAVDSNPVAGVARPSSATATGEGSTPAISAAQARALLQAPDPTTLKGKRDRAILATLLYHGIRREELAKLRVKDVHEREGVSHLRIRGKRGKTRHLPAAPVALRLIAANLEAAGHAGDPDGALFRPVKNNRTGTLRAAKQGADGERITAHPKTSKSRRTLPMFNLRDELLEHHHWQAERGFDETGLVFTNQNGDPVAPWTFNRRELDKVAEAAGITWSVTPNTFRHTFATIHLQLGTPLKIVSEWLGHATIQQTANTYQHLSSEVSMDYAQRYMERLAEASRDAEGATAN